MNSPHNAWSTNRGVGMAPVTRVESDIAWLENSIIFVKFGYDEAYVKECRLIPGRRWDGKYNQFPLDSAPIVRALCEEWGISTSIELALLEDWNSYVEMAEERKYNVTADDKHIVISFGYNPRLIEIIHDNIPGVDFKKGKKKYYEAPRSSITEALEFARVHNLSIDPEIEAEEALIRNSKRELYDHSTLLEWDYFPIPGLAVELRPYQLAAIAYAQRVRRCIIADQQGLGKSATSISTVILDNSLPVVVVCKNRLKETLREDFLKFYPDLTIEILNGGKSKPVEDVDVIIVNYDIVSKRLPDIMEHGFKSLIVDESHYIKNGKKKSVCPHCGYSKLRSNAVNCSGCGAKKIEVKTSYSVRRTDATMKLAHSLPADALVLLLTGTPINIRPGELIRQLECIDRLDLFGGEWKFRHRHCPDNKQALNLMELNTKLRENCFVRRKTKDVLPQLPPVQHSIQRMVLTDEQMERYREIENDVVDYLADKARQRAILEGEDHDAAYWNKYHAVERAEALIRLNVLRGAIVELKYEAMCDWVDNFLDSGDEKIILFAERIKIVEGFYERYKDKAVKVRGDVSNTAALAATHIFQEQDWCRAFIANLASAKEGFTLTAASDVIFCQPSWAPTDHSQGISRCFARINDPHGATAWWLLAPDTIDYDLYKLLQERQIVVDAVTDGVELDEQQKSIQDQLIRILENKGRQS